MFKPKKSRAGFTLIELMIVIAIIAILAAILVPNFLKARAQGQLTACKSNCKNIGTALEMYASDFSGRYPTDNFQQRMTVGNYLKVIPTCPSAATATYAQSYTGRATPDNFSFYCVGNNHATAYVGLNGLNFPQYNGETGLTANPTGI